MQTMAETDTHTYMYTHKKPYNYQNLRTILGAPSALQKVQKLEITIFYKIARM